MAAPLTSVAAPRSHVPVATPAGALDRLLEARGSLLVMWLLVRRLLVLQLLALWLGV